MPAHEDELRDALEEGVRVKNGRGVKRLLGEDGWVKGAELVRCTSVFDSAGGFSPVFDEAVTETLNTGTVIFATGQVPELHRYGLEDLFKTLTGDASGAYLLSTPAGDSRLYAGGDVIHHPGSVAAAIASGKAAALAIHLATLGKRPKKRTTRIGSGMSFSIQEWFHPGTACDLGKVVAFEEMEPAFLEHAPRILPHRYSKEARESAFQVIEKTLELDEAAHEAERCFSCGICTGCDACYTSCPDICIVPPKKEGEPYQTDTDHCKGCALCASVCPRGVISMEMKA